VFSIVENVLEDQHILDGRRRRVHDPIVSIVDWRQAALDLEQMPLDAIQIVGDDSRFDSIGVNPVSKNLDVRQRDNCSRPNYRLLVGRIPAIAHLWHLPDVKWV
jgi:hypothetical protein